MATSSFQVEALIKGIDDIVANIAEIDSKSARKVLVAGLRGATKPIAKRMKSDLSSRVKIARRWVGSKVKSRGKITAKVGFGVGRKLSDMDKIVPKNRSKDKPGVGISAVNVHWWISGTQNRVRRRVSGSPSTGAMPAMQPGLASKAAASAQAEAMRSAEVAAKKQLDKELKRLAKRNR